MFTTILQILQLVLLWLQARPNLKAPAAQKGLSTAGSLMWQERMTGLWALVEDVTPRRLRDV